MDLLLPCAGALLEAARGGVSAPYALTCIIFNLHAFFITCLHAAARFAELMAT